jgi:hypothetical protein
MCLLFTGVFPFPTAVEKAVENFAVGGAILFFLKAR